MGSSSHHFYDVICINERIKQAIKFRPITGPVEKKGFTGKKKEGDVKI